MVLRVLNPDEHLVQWVDGEASVPTIAFGFRPRNRIAIHQGLKVVGVLEQVVVGLPQDPKPKRTAADQADGNGRDPDEQRDDDRGARPQFQPIPEVRHSDTCGFHRQPLGPSAMRRGADSLEQHSIP
jgi:hypothetical protein